MLAAILDWLLSAVNTILNVVFYILPVSPFQNLDMNNATIVSYLQNVNYFIPISDFIAILGFWLSAIGVFYGLQIVLRWIKAIGD